MSENAVIYNYESIYNLKSYKNGGVKSHKIHYL